jgi:hypothetical protein
LASIEPILAYFDWGSARDRNVIEESLVVIVDFEAFCMDVCDVIRAIVRVEESALISRPSSSMTAGAGVPSACNGMLQMRSPCPSCVTTVNFFAACNSRSGKRGLVKYIASYVIPPREIFQRLTATKSVTR